MGKKHCITTYTYNKGQTVIPIYSFLPYCSTYLHAISLHFLAIRHILLYSLRVIYLHLTSLPHSIISINLAKTLTSQWQQLRASTPHRRGNTTLCFIVKTEDASFALHCIIGHQDSVLCLDRPPGSFFLSEAGELCGQERKNGQILA
jgi:hypothetical protein